jgi:hypothetical protein
MYSDFAVSRRNIKYSKGKHLVFYVHICSMPLNILQKTYIRNYGDDAKSES